MSAPHEITLVAAALRDHAGSIDTYAALRVTSVTTSASDVYGTCHIAEPILRARHSGKYVRDNAEAIAAALLSEPDHLEHDAMTDGLMQLAYDAIGQRRPLDDRREQLRQRFAAKVLTLDTTGVTEF